MANGKGKSLRFKRKTATVPLSRVEAFFEQLGGSPTKNSTQYQYTVQVKTGRFSTAIATIQRSMNGSLIGEERPLQLTAQKSGPWMATVLDVSHVVTELAGDAGNRHVDPPSVRELLGESAKQDAVDELESAIEAGRQLRVQFAENDELPPTVENLRDSAEVFFTFEAISGIEESGEDVDGLNDSLGRSSSSTSAFEKSSRRLSNYVPMALGTARKILDEDVDTSELDENALDEFEGLIQRLEGMPGVVRGPGGPDPIEDPNRDPERETTGEMDAVE